MIAAAIGAVGAIAVVVIPMVMASSSPVPTVSPGPSPSPPLVSFPSADDPTIAISTLSQTALAKGGTQYTFTGTSADVGPGMFIFVMAQSPAPAAEGGTWLVSPAAAVAANGNWSVTWDLSTTPPRVKWVATIYDSSCPAGAACAPAPPVLAGPGGQTVAATGSNAPPGPDPAQAASSLASTGPHGYPTAVYSPVHR